MRSSAILFMAIMVFATAAFAVESIRVSYDEAPSDEIATQVELNKLQLKGLCSEFDQLEQQKSLLSKNLAIYDEHFTVSQLRALNSLEVLRPRALRRGHSPEFLPLQNHYLQAANPCAR